MSLWTYQDIVDHVLDVFDVDRTNRDIRLARTAVVNAYRDLPFKTRWNYFDRQTVITTVAPQSDGTIAYDHTGGTYERMVTLTDATWPSWAADGVLLIDDVHYPVEARKSNTQITLSSGTNPGSDLAAETEYTLYQNSYSLPSTFRAVNQVWDASRQQELHPTKYDNLFAALRGSQQTPGDPCEYTVVGESGVTVVNALVLAPPPNTVRRLEVFYQANSRPLSVERYATGTIAISSGGTTVTGTGTTWTSSHVGCVLRVGDSSNEPTSAIGIRTNGTTTNLNSPASHEATILSVASATSLTIDVAAPAAHTVSKYTISDPIDIAQDAMYSAFLRMCEAEFARLSKREDRQIFDNDAKMALQTALAADDRHTNNSGGRHAYWPARPRVEGYT